MKRKGYFTIALALIMLIFSTFAAIFIQKMSDELLITIGRIDEGKKERYNKIVVKSTENSIDYINATSTISRGATSNNIFVLYMPRYYTSDNCSTETTIFSVNSEIVQIINSKQYFFETEVEATGVKTQGAIIKHTIP